MEKKWFLVYPIAQRKVEFAKLLRENRFASRGGIFYRRFDGAEQARVRIGRSYNSATVYSSDEKYLGELRKKFTDNGYETEDPVDFSEIRKK